MEDTRHNVGLTLVEILVVVAIIAVLASLVLAITLGIESKSKEDTLFSTFALLDAALQEYYEYEGQFPVPVPSFDATVDLYPTDLDPDKAEQRRQRRAANRVRSLYASLDSVPDSREILKTISPGLLTPDVNQPDLYRISDPWGTVLDCVYRQRDQFPELISAGPNRKFLHPFDQDNLTSKDQ